MWLDLKSRETEEIRLSREELYDLVWSMPLSRLADDYVITDVAIGKWCKKLNIPKPGVGYWAKVQAGQTPRKPKLPAAKKETPIAIRIRKKIKPAEGQPRTEPTFDRIVVPESLDDPHPVVRRTRTLLGEAKVEEDGCICHDTDETAALYVSKKLLPRALRILNALLRAAEAAGWQVSRNNVNRTVIVVDGAAVPLVIDEMRTFDQNRPRGRSGRLRIELAHNNPMASELCRAWKDGKVKRVEDVLHQVCQGIWRCAQSIRAWEERREQWKREDEERRRQWLLERERQQLEERRQRDLEARLQLWAKVQNIRELVAAIRAAKDELQPAGDPSGNSAEAGGEPGLGERSDWVAWLEREGEACARRAMSVVPVPPFEEPAPRRW